MRPYQYIILALVFIVILTLVYSFYAWYSAVPVPCNIVTIDKGAFDNQTTKHRNFYGLLTYLRVEKRHGGQYHLSRDYYGFVPRISYRNKAFEVRSFSIKEIDSIVNSSDLLYIADIKGTTFSDWYGTELTSANPTVVYGGMTNNDYLLARAMLSKGRKVIFETGTLEPPTDPLVLYKWQNLTGLQFTGWRGKYYSSLDAGAKEVPLWMIEQYKQKHSRWPFLQAGLVLTNNSTVVVLEENVDFKGFPLYIEPRPELKYAYNLESSYYYKESFEITHAGSNTVEASFRFDVNTIGREKLLAAGIPLTFPCFVTGEKLPYLYFAADFSSSEIPLWPLRFAGYKTIHNHMACSPGYLFHPFYQAIMEPEIKKASAGMK